MLFKNEYDLNDDEESDSDSNDSFDSNLFLKISDFGISHPINLETGKAYMKYKSGTHYYTAPEVTNVFKIYIKSFLGKIINNYRNALLTNQ